MTMVVMLWTATLLLTEMASLVRLSTAVPCLITMNGLVGRLGRTCAGNQCVDVDLVSRLVFH